MYSYTWPDFILLSIECDTGRKRHTRLVLVRISRESTGLTGEYRSDVRNLLESVTRRRQGTFHLGAEQQQVLSLWHTFSKKYLLWLQCDDVIYSSLKSAAYNGHILVELLWRLFHFPLFPLFSPFIFCCVVKGVVWFTAVTLQDSTSDVRFNINIPISITNHCENINLYHVFLIYIYILWHLIFVNFVIIIRMTTCVMWFFAFFNIMEKNTNQKVFW